MTPPLDARLWWRIGWLSFGGPAGQIALMQRLLVDELRWIDPQRFLAALNFCMLLPGPEAQQLATWIGWTRAGWRGAFVAGGLFVLPGMLVMLGLSAAYVAFGRMPWVEAAFLGVKCAVVAIVLQALLRLARRALAFRGALAVAGAAFVALHFLAWPYPVVVALAAAIGAWRGRGAVAPASPPSASAARTSWPLVAAVALAWLAPLALLLVLRGADDLVMQLGLMNAELAVVTFGGAYAALAYAGERAVAVGWIDARQMADGLGLAETTPGPLILVLQFVAFVAAWQSVPGGDYGLAGLAAALATWCLFLPSFLWIFLGAPHLERVAAAPRLRAALDHVTAAVVGVIANLSLWFALHVMFGRVEARTWGWLHAWTPDPATLDMRALGLAAVAALLMFGLRWPLLRTLMACAAVGLALGPR